MRTTALIATCIAAMTSPSFAARGQSSGGSRAIETAAIDISRRRAPVETYDNHFGTRFGLGVLGFAGGALIGYHSGAMISRCDRCYFGASGEMIIGSIGGALIGTSLLAIPSFGSPCTSKTRIRRVLAGEVVGYVLGLIVIGPLFPHPTPFVEPGVALTTVLGGLVAQGRC
jgi:hypothetical protein